MTESMVRDPLFQSALQEMKNVFRNESGCHDLDHTLRVLENARILAEAELAKTPEPEIIDVIRFAALLHDCARPEEDASKGQICHARAGMEKSARILRHLGCTDEKFIEQVAQCIGRHRYRGDDKPVTIAEKIVYDADKLDSVGAVGIGRAFMFAANCGARLHNTAEEALGGDPCGREDSAYREYLVKLKDVPGRMLTETGRKLAAERAEFMHRFFEVLNQETQNSLKG